MPYTYPEFAHVQSIDQVQGKRYSLIITMGPMGDRTLLVIQKNPSKADEGISDHTINRVLNYIHKNRNSAPILAEVGRVVFLNLIPRYETYSRRLSKINESIEDPRNLEVIDQFIQEGHPCIVAWGNPPVGLKGPYERLADKVLSSIHLMGNPVYRTGSLTRLGYPRHGQIWGYRDPLLKFGGNHKNV